MGAFRTVSDELKISAHYSPRAIAKWKLKREQLLVKVLAGEMTRAQADAELKAHFRLLVAHTKEHGDDPKPYNSEQGSRARTRALERLKRPLVPPHHLASFGRENGRRS